MGGFTLVDPSTGQAVQPQPTAGNPTQVGKFRLVDPADVAAASKQQKQPATQGRGGPLYLKGEGHLGGLQNKLLDYADKIEAEHFKGKEAEARYYSAGKHGFDASWLDALTDPGAYARMGADVLGVAGGLAAHPLQTAASVAPVTRTVMLPYFGYQGAKMIAKGREKGESTPDYVQRILLGSSMLAGAAGGLGKSAPEDFATTRSAASAMPDVIKAVKDSFPRKTVVENANNFLEESKNQVLQTVEQAHKTAKAEIGKKVADIVSEDKNASPRGVFPASAVHRVIDSAEGTRNAPKTVFTHTEAVRDLLNAYSQKFQGMLSWENIKDLRSEIGSRFARAGGKDLSALGELYKGFTNVLRNRAAQLGKVDEFDEYNKLTKDLDEASASIAKKLENAPSGAGFFKTLSDKQLKPQLRAYLGLLEKHGGLKPGAVEELVDQHKPILNLSEQAREGRFGAGRLTAFMRHPAAAIPAGIAAYALPLPAKFLWSMIAANKAAELADQFDAARAMQRPRPGMATPAMAVGAQGQGGVGGAPQGQPPQGLPPGAPPGLSPASPQGLPAQATPPAVAQPPVQTPAQVKPPQVQPTTPSGGTAGAVNAPKVPAKAYEAFGVALDPSQWKTPEDVLAGKAQARSQVTTEITSRGKAIVNALKQGLITKASADEQIAKLQEGFRNAMASIDKVKAEGVSRGARDRLRKGAQSKARDTEIASQEQTKERTSGASMEDAVGRVAELEKSFKALGEHKRYIEVVRELEKSGSDNYVTWANELEDAYSEVLKKHSKAPSEQDEIDEFRELIGRAKRTPEQQTRYEELRRLAVEARETNSPLAPAWKRLLNVSLKPGYE